MGEEEAHEMTELSLGNGGCGGGGGGGGVNRPRSPAFQLEGALLLDEEGGGSDGGRRRRKKKLRLRDEQVAVLEGAYDEHCVLDPVMKQGLAKTLNIRQRQVEVWFQNRRARSKQKQMATDHDSLRRRSEWLMKENQKLKQELHDLSMRSSHSHHGTGSSAVAVCSSCNKIFRDHNLSSH